MTVCWAVLVITLAVVALAIDGYLTAKYFKEHGDD